MITLVQQQANDTCMTACLAMVTGLDYQLVLDTFDPQYKENYPTFNQSTYLTDLGIEHTLLPAIAPIPEEGYLYIATVPSLNLLASSHAVVIGFDEEGDFMVWDPNQGRVWKKYYVPFKATNELEVPISSYQLTVAIKVETIRQLRKRKLTFPHRSSQ